MTQCAIPTKGIIVSAGLDISALLKAMTHAKTMVWHAAIYNNFAHGEIASLLSQRLDDDLQHLAIISQQPCVSWQAEFAVMLRPHQSSAEVSELQQTSLCWCQRLTTTYPTKVSHHVSDHLPTQPILLIGDTIFIGQYAHSHTTSAQGLWLQIDSCALGLLPNSLYQWYCSGVPSSLSGWAQAIGRYVDECRQMQLSVNRYDDNHAVTERTE